jgi:hypothetical protein
VGLHLAGAAWAGVSPLPDQSLNLGIAAGHATALLSMETLTRWPVGAWRAWLDACGGGPGWVGGVGLAVAAWRGDRPSRGLLGLAVAQVLVVGLAFSNPRLVLPAAICLWLGIALGGRALVRHRAGPAVLGLAGLAWLWVQRERVGQAEVAAARVAGVAEAARAGDLGPCVATSPWFHTRAGGWLQPSIQLSGLRVSPQVGPEGLAEALRREGVDCVAFDAGRARWPNLGALLGDEPVEGWRRVAAHDGWHLWALSTPLTPRPRG